MKEEALTIESIQSRITEYQKRIQFNYFTLHNEELDETASLKLVEDINQLKEMVYGLQNRLKAMYKEMFSGAKKQPVIN